MQSDTLYSFFGRPITSFEVLVVGAILLVVAACLLIFSRRQRVALDRSWTTDELMLHLSRIAEALDRLAARPPDRVVVESPRPAETSPEAASAKEGHTIPYSMFGREFQPGN